MTIRDYIENPVNLTRPKGVSDKQWTRALKLYKAAQNVGDKFPELTVAQAALETGWFKKESGKNNYFGQKATKNQAGSDVRTHEVYDGKTISITDRFRDYDTLEDSLTDRKNKWMSKYKDASTPREAIGKIWQYDENKKQGRGYATDPEYGAKIGKILSMIGVEEKSTPTTTVKEKEVPKEVKEAIEVPIDNTYAVPTKSSANAVYADISKKEETKTEQSLNEEKLRELLAEERAKTEERFMQALEQQRQPEQQTIQEYQPQPLQQDLSHLYNYIDIND